MWNFKKLLSGSKTSPEQPENDHGGDYAVKRSKRTDLIARILAILAALLLWAYVTTTNSTTEERNFSLVPVTYREESILKNEYGLIVQSINIDTLNVTLMGNKTDVRQLTASDVKAYVNLGSITRAGEYELDVYVDVPSGTTCVAQTVDKVMVSVDKPATKTLPLSSDNVVLSGWSLDKDCFFGDITLNAEAIIIEGPTLELEKVADVELRTDVIGNASDSFSATVTAHFMDAEGDEIVGSGVSVQGGNHLRVSVEVLKTAKVKLVLDGKNGPLSDEQVTLNPTHVWLTGEPSALAGRKELVVGSIDETVLTEDSRQTYPLTLDGIEITNESGERITSVTATVKANVQPAKTVTVTDIPVWQGEAVIGYVAIDITAENAVDGEILDLLTADNITVYSPADNLTGDLNKMTVSFDKPYLAAIDEYKLYAFRGAV